MAPRDNPSARRSQNNTTQNGYSGEHNFERMPLQQSSHYILHSISHAQRRRRPRPLIVFIIILHDGRAAAGSDGQALTMVLWIGRCGRPGSGGEAKPRGGMVDGIVMKRLHVGRRLRLMGGGRGGRQVQWWWKRRCYCFFVLMVIF